MSFDEDWLFQRGRHAGAQAPSYRDSDWRRLDLPHDWSIEDLPGGSHDGAATTNPAVMADVTDPTFGAGAPGRIGPFDKDETAGGKSTAHTVGGEGWYRKHFRLTNVRPGQRVIVEFGGVYCNSDMWLNGKHLGFHPQGYTPFSYDLTAHLHPRGDNVLAVRVRNTGETSRWFSGSGIYRHTRLHVVDAVHVPLNGTAITTPSVTPTEALVKTVVELRNRRPTAAAVSARVTLIGPTGYAVSSLRSRVRVLRSGGTSAVEVTQLVRRPHLWSPAAPSLYRAHVEVMVDGTVVDSVIESFGIRTIKFDNRGFFLNGKPIKMRGANIHHDHGAMGAVGLYASEERRIRELKKAGFNAVRTSHNAPSCELLDACDRLGMLLYTELTDMWDGGKKNEDYHLYFAKWWKRDARSLVRLDRNHPSVVIRSIGNEVGLGTIDAESGPPLAKRGAQMAAFMRKLDPTRPVTQGGGDSPQIGSSSADYCDVGDVHYDRDVAAKAAQYPGKAWIQSESYVGSLYEYWMQVEHHDYLVGDFTWTAWDYLGEAGLGHPLPAAMGMGDADPSEAQDIAQLLYSGQVPYPWFGAWCGDIDMVAQLKPQMRYRRVVWGISDLELLVQRPTPGVEAQRAGWAWVDELESWTWDVPPLTPLRVRTYTTGDQVELFLNGAPAGVVSLTESSKRIATFDVPFAPGSLVAVASKEGREIGRKQLTTSGAPAALRLRTDRRQLTTSRDDLAHVIVEIVDHEGNLCPDAVVKVQFGVTGGTLIGVDNGHPANVDSFKRPRRHTFHGRALAIIRPPKKVGQVTINAFAAGLRGDSLSMLVVDRPYPR
jgi:beta-galactosidase